MPKYINADKFLQKVQEHHYILRSFDNSKDFGMFDCGIKQIINEMPAADVVEVVRCKDCEYSVQIGEHYFCNIQYDKWGEPYIVKPDGYCDCGERKEQDE